MSNTTTKRSAGDQPVTPEGGTNRTCPVTDGIDDTTGNSDSAIVVLTCQAPDALNWIHSIVAGLGASKKGLANGVSEHWIVP